MSLASLKKVSKKRLNDEGSLEISPDDIRNFDALTDEPTILVYQEVDQQYSGSKFVLTVRERESWLRSIENNGNAMKEWRQQFLAVPVLHETLYGNAEFDPEIYAAAYEKHLESVKTYFADRPKDLLIMNICGGEGWEKLCSFLEKEIPDQPFAKTNVFGVSDAAILIKQGKIPAPRAQK